MTTTAIQLAGVKCPFKAVAEYPPALPYVGQDDCYHRLEAFTVSVQHENEAHFFAAFGDWAIGKSRLAHELIAQFCGHSRGWVLSEGTATEPLLRPLAEGGTVVPLFVSFVDALYFEQFGLDIGTAIGKLTCAAAALLADQRRARSSHRDLLAALRDALMTVDPNFDFDRLADIATDANRNYADRAHRITQTITQMTHGRATRLLVIVDEVESGADVNPFADEIEREVNSRPIPLKSVIDLYSSVKNATNTNAYPDLNFVFLNTQVSRRVADMPAFERRMTAVDLQKATADDLDQLMAALRRTQYPLVGTLEDLARRAFFAADRNLGWFSFIMNKAHYILVQQPELSISSVFAEVCERTRGVFQPRVFEDRDIQPAALKDAMRAIIYNQIPATLPELRIAPALRSELLSYQDPFQTHFVGAAAVVEISADQLTSELLATGQYASEQKPKLTGEGSANFDPALVLASLRTFTWSHDGAAPGGSAFRLWIYEDPADFEGQVGFAYPGFGSNLSATTVRTIHTLLLEHHRTPAQAPLVAPTMSLLRRFNELWGKAAASNWLNKEPDWERIVSLIDRTPDKNDERLLRGIANTLFDAPQPQTSPTPYPGVTAPCLVLKLESHEKLNVTPRNQFVILKARDKAEDVVQDLREIKQRVPVLLVFARGGDRDAWQRYLRETHQEHLTVAVIPHVVEPQTREWEFYLRFALRDDPNGFKWSDMTGKGRELRNEFHDVLLDKFNQWLAGIEAQGYVLRPLFPAKSANLPAFREFAQAYAALLGAGDTARLGPRAQQVVKGLENYERERHADMLLLVEGAGTDSRAVVPPVFPRILDLLRPTPRKLPELEGELFYGRSGRTVSFPTTGLGVLEQVMALLQELGMVETDAQGRYLVRTVSAIGAKFDLAFQRLGTFEGSHGGYVQQVSALSPVVQELASQLAVNEHQLSLLKTQELDPRKEQLDTLPLNRLFAVPADQEAFRQVAHSIVAVATALDKVLGRPGQSVQPPDIDPHTLQDRINQIAKDAGYGEFSIEYRVNFLKALAEYLTQAEQGLREVIAERRRTVEQRYARTQGGDAFPTRPILALLDGVERDLDDAIGGTVLPPELREKATDAPLKVLKGAGRLSDVLLKLAWYQERLDEGSPNGWWVRFTNAYAAWQSALDTYTAMDRAWNELERYFAGTAPEHTIGFTGADLPHDVANLRETVRAFAETNDDTGVSLEDLAREITAIQERSTALQTDIMAARAAAQEEITSQLGDARDAAITRLAIRQHKENILPSRQRVTDARTHQEAHAALEHYQHAMQQVGVSLCKRPEILELYQQVYQDLNGGMPSDALIKRYGEAKIRELSDQQLVSMRWVVEV